MHASRIDWPSSLEQHRRWLRTVIYARLRDSAATDEVWQEVAVALLRASPRPTDPAKVAPWLYRVAIVQSLQYRRAAGRRRKLLTRYAERCDANHATDDARDPLEWLLSVERRQLVRRAVSELKPRDAEILLLKYTEDWTYRELADHLGLSEAAIEARLHRARARLRRALVAFEIVRA